MGNTLPLMQAVSGANGLVRGTVLKIDEAGLVQVRPVTGEHFACEVLQAGAFELVAGDTVLAFVPSDGEFGVVLGCIGRCSGTNAVPEHLELCSTESLTLRCGSSSIDLRADGKVMIRGEDVLLRAKGTQRIRAGTVSIN